MSGTSPTDPSQPAHPATPVATGPTPAPSPTPTRRRRWRWLGRIGVVLAAILLAGYIVLTNSFATRLVALALIEHATGADAKADAVRFEPSGRIIIEGFELRAREITGEGGVILRVARAEAILAPASRGLPAVVLSGLFVDRPMIRLSQGVVDQRVNLASLQPRSSGGGSAPLERIPRIVIRGGQFQVGEHDPAGRFTLLRAVDLAGEVAAAPDGSGNSIVELRQVGGLDQALPGGLAMRGLLAHDRITLQLDAFDLGGIAPSAIPTPLRSVYTLLGPTGRITRAEVSYDFAAGPAAANVSATIGLADVAMNLPLRPQPDVDSKNQPLPMPPELRDRLLRMDRVQGTLRLERGIARADLRGILEDVPARVQMDLRGTTADSPFDLTITTTDLALTADREILRFATGLARYRLAQFGNPTGIVDAQVTIGRGPPVAGADGTPEPAPMSVRGRIDFREASAAFHKFPYRFYNLQGSVTFDEQAIRMTGVTGNTPAGATVTAEGTFAPPTDDAGVRLDIQARGVPVDDTLAQAMGPRRPILEAIFSQPALETAINAGLLARDDPRFAMGGRLDIGVVIDREPGEWMPWHDTITIALPRVGVVPQAFPYPLIAEGVTIVKRDGIATVSGGTYTGLTGARVRLAAEANLEGTSFVPTLDIEAEDVPVDGLLAHALPQRDGPRPPAEVLRDLRVSGTIDAAIRVQPPVQPPVQPAGHADTSTLSTDASVIGTEAPTPYDIRLSLDGLSANPGRLDLREISGFIHLTDRDAAFKLDADVVTPSAVPGEPDTRSAATVAMTLERADLASTEGVLPAGGVSPIARARLDASSLRLPIIAPIEDLLRAFDPAAADALARVREERQPEGVLNVAAAVRQEARDLSIDLTFSDLRGVRASAMGGRLGIDSDAGSATLHLRRETDAASGDTSRDPASPGIVPAGLSFAEFGARATFDGEPTATLRLVGSISPDARPMMVGDAANPLANPLAVGATDARLQSPLLRAIIARVLPAGLAASIAEADLAGVVDADITLTPRLAPGVAPAWDARGEIRPRSLALTRAGVRLDFPDARGSLAFDPGLARLVGLELSSADLVAGATGTIRTAEDGSSSLEGSLALGAPAMTPSLRAALPPALTGVLEDLAFDVLGPIESVDIPLRAELTPGGEVRSLHAHGRVALQRVRADLGLPIAEADAAIDFTLDRRIDEPFPAFSLRAHATRLRLAGLAMTDAHATVEADAQGRITIPDFTALAHGGKLAGSASIAAPDGRDQRRYDAEVRLSGLRLASVLGDLQSGDVAPPEDPPAPDGSRGMLDAAASLTGIIGQPDSRSGRGSGRAWGGRVVSFPLLVPLLRAANLQLPIDERLDHAHADFYLAGSTVAFERLFVASRSVGVYGLGTLALPDLSLDLRFRARNHQRIPLVTDVLESIRDELATTTVRGRLTDPQVGTRALAGTGEMLERVMGISPTQQEALLDRIEANAGRPLDRDQAPRVGGMPRADGPQPVEPTRTAEGNDVITPATP